MKAALPPAIVLLGILLAVGGLLWNVMFPASRNWTKEKSVQLTELGNQATQIKLQLLKAKEKPSMHSGQSAAELQEQYDKVAADYKILYDEFHNVSESPKTISAYLKWTGIALVLVGAGLVLATREA